MGGVELHQELKNLCVNTDWKYAVFWKLKHQVPMVLAWEDAYCDDEENHDRRISNWFDNVDHDSNQDLVGLAVARMAYSIYSIGEGIVGRVAATGKHQWVSRHQLVNSSWCSSDEHFDGWKAQFTAGIRTVVVISVFPHGVVQLGSLNTIAEDLKTVNHIREIFFDLKSSFTGSTDCSPCITDLSTSSVSGRFHNPVNNQDRTIGNNKSNTWSIAETTNNLQENENPLSDIVQSGPGTDQNRNLFAPASSTNQTEPKEPFKFPAGCELYEVLGPAFYNRFDWETTTTETLTVDEIPETTSLTERSDSENLLEAVVAKVCCSDNSDNKGSTVFGQTVNPVQRLTGGSVCHPFERFSSESVGGCGERLDRGPREPAKVGKKRARPGESCRPRPRDRQLIQDRIKELRQLVPSGSKCSIDSLLERTIKHMVFMQCVTKHADKIDKCAEFKLASKEKGGHEHGSSWALEVGNELEVCPIVVENIGLDGQMLVEMMCDECVQFLEMGEAMRALGLTVLKGVTDAYGDKTWMCFIVEGENNRNIHRMDILWSLVRILQSKTNA